MRLLPALRHMARETRGSRGKLVFFVACLAVGVSAVVAVAGLASSIDDRVRTEARQLLAADLVVSGRRSLSAKIDAALARLPGTTRANVKETATVVAAPPRNGSPGRSQLVELKAVGEGYPFYGTLRLVPDVPLSRSLDGDGVVVAPELLGTLGLHVGDPLLIGGIPFEIRGTVLAEPDRIRVSFTLGPRVFVSMAGMKRAGLEEYGSRISYRVLVKMPTGSGAAELEKAAAHLRAALPESEGFEVETFSDAQPALRAGIQRAGRFLGLVALLSLLVGGVGVAQTVRAWIATRIDSIAILKCLGLRPREVLSLYLGQTVFLGIVGSLVGAFLGTLLILVVPPLLRPLLPAVEVSPWQPAAVLRGIGLGVGIAVLFGLPPLSAVLRIPPARVLRHDAEPLPSGRIARLAAGIFVASGIFATAWVQSRSALLGAWFTVGIAAAVGLLAVAALLLTHAVTRYPRDHARVWLRHGLRAIARPGAGTLGAIVALGLGVLVVSGMYLVHTRLTAQLGAEVPADAPTVFLIDIQPGQWEGVKKIVDRAQADRIRTVPIVSARLSKIDGRPVAEIASTTPEEGRRRWVFTREQNLTYLDTLPADNTVVEGALWSDPKRPEISIERDFARDLGVRVGSMLTFDVQGVPIDLEVTSLRTVDWKTFGINFFLIVEPGVLEKAPQARVAAMRLPRGGEQALQDQLAAAYPNVTVLKIREILEKIVAILDRLGLGIRFLGGFTVLAGIAILAGAVSAGSVRRGREVALLKTLGMTRRGVVAVFAVEYALVGLVAGAIGAVGGGVLAWAVVTRGMDLTWQLRPSIFAVALAGSVTLSVLAGVAASLRSLAKRPIDVLRAE